MFFIQSNYHLEHTMNFTHFEACGWANSSSGEFSMAEYNPVQTLIRFHIFGLRYFWLKLFFDWGKICLGF